MLVITQTKLVPISGRVFDHYFRRQKTIVHLLKANILKKCCVAERFSFPTVFLPSLDRLRFGGTEAKFRAEKRHSFCEQTTMRRKQPNVGA